MIPEDIRGNMGLHTGDQFIVVADKDVVILKIIQTPSLGEFKGLITEARKEAKKAGLTRQSIKEAIKGTSKNPNF